MSSKRMHRGCPSYAVCKDLQALLKRVGVPKLSIEYSCDPESQWPCKFLSSNVHTLYAAVDPENAVGVLEFVSSLFARTDQMLSSGLKRNLKRGPFHCPELDIDIFQPCRVGSCSFHTDNDWTLNCILFYRLHQGKEILSLNELSFLLGSDVGALRSNLNKAFRFLSEAALKETITREHTEELMDRVHPPNVCAVCERRVDVKGHHYTSGFFLLQQGLC